MSYLQPNSATNQNSQMATMAIVLFVTIVAAVTFSAILVTSIIKGEVAKAVSNTTPVSTTQSINSPVASTVAAATGCVAPSEAEASDGAVVTATAHAGKGGAKALPWGLGGGSISGSFNNTNTSTTNTTNVNTKNVTKTKTTIINDSFKVGTDNVVITDNNVNSNNPVTNTTTTVTTNTDNSNNSVNNSNSNNNVNIEDNVVASTVIEDNQVAIATGLVAVAVND